jgi:hypothetical protein
VANAIDDARSLIQSRLADLDAEAKSLERALASLGDGGKARRRGPGRPRKAAAAATSAPANPKRSAPRKRKRAKRAARGQRREQFLAAVKAKPGARVSELAREIGISPGQGHALAKRLHKEGAIRKRGKGYALKG